MKRFLVLALIYSLNILMFLFAKSAGASVVVDYSRHLTGRSPAIECLKRVYTKGNLKRCKLVAASGAKIRILI
jgi:hypothetical protein